LRERCGVTIHRIAVARQSSSDIAAINVNNRRSTIKV
jgi:hypothetical protein